MPFFGETPEKPIALRAKPDGVYLSLDKAKGAFTRNDILDLLIESRVKEVDFGLLNSVVDSDPYEITFKVSNNSDVLVKKEDVKVDVSGDRMSATVTFLPPLNCDDLINASEAVDLIRKNKIEYGIDEDKIYELFPKRRYGVPYKVIEGTAPVNGVDGKAEFRFNSMKNYRPKELAGGRVDYRQIHTYEMAITDDILIVLTPPQEGADGMNVLGKRLPHKKGAPAPKINPGKNIKVSEDGLTIRAATNGRVVYKDRKIEVVPVLQIDSDVNNTVGNIDFVGAVVIKGGVLSGFSIKATHNIEIGGVVESAFIESYCDLFLYAGVKGRGKGVVRAGGDITAKYIDRCTVHAGGNIHADSITHSTVRCNGGIELAGKDAMLVGGSAIVRERIVADVIGAKLSAYTEINLGYPPDSFAKYRELQEKIEYVASEFALVYDEHKRALEKINKASQRERDIYNLNWVNIKAYYDDKLDELTVEQELIAPDLFPECYISARKMICAGTRLFIAGVTDVLAEDVAKCKAYECEKRIEYAPLRAGE
ncbi:MAG: FapA family protein [Clostridiales bacterium]|jgi:uncharacterized protein (DUF342 family)|nr:FapA family protein [Clostridiales bacterium]